VHLFYILSANLSGRVGEEVFFVYIEW